jgi:hypothetical protein
MLLGEITNQFNEGHDIGIMAKAKIALTFNHIIKSDAVHGGRKYLWIQKR